MDVQVDWYADWLSPIIFVLLVCIFTFICITLLTRPRGERWNRTMRAFSLTSAITAMLLSIIVILVFLANQFPSVSEQVEDYYGIELGTTEREALDDVVGSGTEGRYAPLLAATIDGKSGYLVGIARDDGDDNASVETTGGDAVSVRYFVVQEEDTFKDADGKSYRHVDLYRYDLADPGNGLEEVIRDLPPNPYYAVA